jgi:hypothetical protein
MAQIFNAAGTVPNAITVHVREDPPSDQADIVPRVDRETGILSADPVNKDGVLEGTPDPMERIPDASGGIQVNIPGATGNSAALELSDDLPLDVALTASAGVGTEGSRDDHAHRGVSSISTTYGGSVHAFGHVSLVESGNITIRKTDDTSVFTFTVPNFPDVIELSNEVPDPVDDTPSVGIGTEASRDDHRHEGLHSLELVDVSESIAEVWTGDGILTFGTGTKLTVGEGNNITVEASPDGLPEGLGLGSLLWWTTVTSEWLSGAGLGDDSNWNMAVWDPDGVGTAWVDLGTTPSYITSSASGPSPMDSTDTGLVGFSAGDGEMVPHVYGNSGTPSIPYAYCHSDNAVELVTITTGGGSYPKVLVRTAAAGSFQWWTVDGTGHVIAPA